VHGWIAHRPGGTGDWRAAFWSPWPAVAGAVVLDGVFMAGHRRVFEAVRFDEATFDGFHCYDVDFTWRASRAGHRIGVCGNLALVHESVGAFDAKWQVFAERFVATVPEANGPQRPSHRYEVALGSPELALAFFRRLEQLALAKLAQAGAPA
jgi:GT2 family glycosyltransferase